MSVQNLEKYYKLEKKFHNLHASCYLSPPQDIEIWEKPAWKYIEGILGNISGNIF